MFDFFADLPNRGLEEARSRIESEFFEACTIIDGLMGIFYPGHDEEWVDYDEGLLYD